MSVSDCVVYLWDFGRGGQDGGDISILRLSAPLARSETELTS